MYKKLCDHTRVAQTVGTVIDRIEYFGASTEESFSSVFGNMIVAHREHSEKTGNIVGNGVLLRVRRSCAMEGNEAIEVDGNLYTLLSVRCNLWLEPTISYSQVAIQFVNRRATLVIPVDSLKTPGWLSEFEVKLMDMTKAEGLEIKRYAVDV